MFWEGVAVGLVVSMSFLSILDRVFGFGVIVSEEALLDMVVDPGVLVVVPEGDPEPVDEGFDVGFPLAVVNEEGFRLGMLTKVGDASVPGR